jgi:probable F420-dependent oxidoreductase
MDIGIVFPQMEISADRGGVKAFGEAADSLGFTQISSFDHVVGANLENRPDWKMMRYTLETEILEPFVLFGFLAGVTENLGFSTSVMILPQRQTVLVAKQSATVDYLCGGRFRLGIGTGWNEVEYESLNEDFKSRGKRSEEQIEVMLALWSNNAVDFKGEWHSIPDAGIAPLPIQRPIPVWLGGGATNVVLRRIARLSDGWMPQWQPNDESLAELERVHGIAKEFGRNPSDIGLDGRLPLTADNSDNWAAEAAAWEDAGATHMSIVTMNDGLTGADAHIRRLEEFRSAVPV